MVCWAGGYWQESLAQVDSGLHFYLLVPDMMFGEIKNPVVVTYFDV